jgi:MFS family permease
MRLLLNRAFGRTFGDNSWYLCVEIFWATIYASSQSFNGAFAIRLGATNAEVSLLTSVPALTAVLFMLPSGRFLQSRRDRKKWLLSSLLVSRLGTLLFILVPWLRFGAISPGSLFVGLLVLWTIPAHFFNLGFIPFLAQAVRERNRADTFAARNVLAGIVMTVFNILFGMWLARIAFPANYQAMYLFGLAFALLSLYYLARVKVEQIPHVEVPSPAAPFWRSLTRQWSVFTAALRQVKGFTRILVNTFLHGVGLWTAAPLYLLYYVRELGATEAWLGVFGAVGSFSTIFGYLFWRRVMARWGEPKTLKWTIVLIGLYPLLAGAIPSLSAILLIAGLNGLVSAGVNLSHFNTFLKLVPEKEQHNYTALYLTLLNVGAFVCPLIGVALANRFGFAPVLVGCGLASILGSTSFWWWPVGHAPAPPAEAAPA